MNVNVGSARGAGARIESAAYVDTFFRELSPAWLSYVAALRGLDACNLDRPFTYIDLGCGLGQSAIVNAGAYPHGDFHACDFNASHIEAGRAYAAAVGIGNVQFHESSFEDLLSRDLPAFDFVVLHGVYSWIDAGARDAVRQFVQRRLKPGGLLYLSYNCMPGWASEAPLRRLFLELAAAEAGTLREKAERGLQKLQKLCDAKLSYFNLHPAAQGAVTAYGKQPGEYLVHEFLTDSWQPFYSVDVADEMRQLGLQCVGSATLVDNHDALTMESRVMSSIAGLDTERERQLAADFAMNRYFRRDVFARLDGAADARHLARVVIGRLEATEPIPHQIRVPRGVISFQRAFVDELTERMSRGSVRIDELVESMRGGAERGAAEIVRNLTFLVAAGMLTPFAQVRSFDSHATGRQPANAMVRKVIDFAARRGLARAIPSETLGNGVEIEPLQALALEGIMAGVDRPDELSGRLMQELQRSSSVHLIDAEARDAMALVSAVARTTVYDMWPRLARLGVFT
jgi:SAM-dependent methyltransferase